MFTTILTPTGEKANASAMFADSTFFDIFSFKLEEGDPSKVLSREKSMVITRSFANKIFGDQNPVGKYLTVRGREVLITGVMESFPRNTHIDPHDFILSYDMVKYGQWGGEGVLGHWGNSSFAAYFLAKEGMDLPARSEDVKEAVRDIYPNYKEGYAKKLVFTPLCDVYFDTKRAGSLDTHAGSKSLTTVYMGVAVLVPDSVLYSK